MSRLTVNRAFSGIEPRETASLSIQFTAVRPDTERNSFSVSSVGFTSSERFRLRNLARIRDAFLTRRLPLPSVQPLETWIPSSRHDSGGDRFVQTVTDRSWTPRGFSILLARRPIRSPRTRYGPRWPWKLVADLRRFLLKRVDFIVVVHSWVWGIPVLPGGSESEECPRSLHR